MILRVVSMYGLVVAINIGLMLLVASRNMVIFTAADIANTPFSWMANSFTVGILNTIVVLLFYLVGISFIFQIPKIIQAYVGTSSNLKDGDIKGMEAEKQDVMQYGENVVKGTTAVYKKAMDVVTGKAAVDKIKGIKDWVPGSAIVKDIKRRKNDNIIAKSNKMDMKNAYSEMMGTKNKYGNNQPKPPAGGTSSGDSTPPSNGEKPPVGEGTPTSTNGGATDATPVSTGEASAGQPIPKEKPSDKK